MEDWPEIAFPVVINDVPTEGPWKLSALYKAGANNKELYWQIGFDGDNIVSAHGQVGGAIQYEEREVTITATMIKKGYDRTDFLAKAVKEVERKLKDKMKTHYAFRGETTEGFTGMKGQEWEGVKRIKSWPVCVQPKLDGIRMLANETSLLSYKGLSYEHLTNIRTHVNILLDFLPEGSWLDGELYIHNVPFQAISSIVRRAKTEHEEIDKLQYWLFDVCCDREGTLTRVPYEDRLLILTDAVTRYARSVPEPCIFVLDCDLASDETAIEALKDKYEKAGYEGAMIKQLANGANKGPQFEASLYVRGRTWNIMKWKRVHDAEALIVDIEEGKGRNKDTAKFILELSSGKQFKAQPLGTTAERRAMLADRENLIGKLATYKYQELSQDGIPRFAQVKTVRDYE